MSAASVKLIYFAWVRERIGRSEEMVVLPPEVETVSDVLDWLRSRGAGYAEALRFPEVIRVALDQEHADHRDVIGGTREIALFPPMTGG